VPKKLGIVVPAFDVNALAKALQKMLAVATDRTLETKRREFARSYDWDILAEKQQQVYEQQAAGLFMSEEHEKSLDPSQRTMESLFIDIARKHDHKKRSASIVLIGNYGNGNTGDEAILAGLHAMASPFVNVYVLARSAQDIRKLHGIDAVDRGTFQGIKTLLRADVLAIGGGGIFGQGMPPLVRLLPIVGLVLSILGKDVIFVAIGADPTMPKSTARILRLLGRTAYAVTVRETTTATFFGKRARPVVVDDPAISLKPASLIEVSSAIHRKAVTGRLLISLKPTPHQATNALLIKNAAEAADWWVEHTGTGVDFLCLSVHGDFGYGMSITDKTMSQDARKLCKHRSSISIIGPDLKPRVAKGLISAASGVIGARLHALIFAHATNTPVFGLTFETKSRTFLRSIGAEFMEANTTQTDDLYRWLKKLSKGTKS
jgi:polysaccharide pyruvyl transferase WcaK-like protein